MTRDISHNRIDEATARIYRAKSIPQIVAKRAGNGTAFLGAIQVRPLRDNNAAQVVGRQANRPRLDRIGDVFTRLRCRCRIHRAIERVVPRRAGLVGNCAAARHWARSCGGMGSHDRIETR